MNVCHDMLRKRRTVPLPQSIALSDSCTPEDRANREQQRRSLAAALERLPEKERMAIVLRDIEGLSTSEVAETLGSSETTVRSQISVARAKLRGWLKERRPL
jgi:RNA polymerase sigma-70 factor, ECF subfamily